MVTIDYITFFLAIVLNFLLYIFFSRRQILKIKHLTEFLTFRKEREKLLLQTIDDKQKIIESYSHEINSCEREKTGLKDEIVELERIVNDAKDVT